MEVTIDSRIDNKLTHIVNQGVIDVISLTLTPFTMDTAYTLILDEGQPSQWNVPITIDPSPSKTIRLTIDSTGKPIKVYIGVLRSTSNVAGVYYRCNVRVNVVAAQ